MRWPWHIVLAAFGLLSGPPCSHAEGLARDDELKAAFILNFIQFSVWPPPTGPEFNLCLLGVSAIEPALADLAGRPVHGSRPFRTKLVKEHEDLTACNAFYLDERYRTSADRVLHRIGRSEVLTITDASGLADRGWMIEIARVGNRWGFDINLTAARRANIGLSSKLLQLARFVGQRPSHE